MSNYQIASLRMLMFESKGKFFTCTFRKANGKVRTLLGRVGVWKHTNGVGLSYNPVDHDLVTVWDAQNKGYRQVNVTRLLHFKCGYLKWDAVQ